MKNENGIVFLKDYGKIRITLQPLMEARNIKINKLAKSIGSDFPVIKKWYNGSVERMDLDVLARICFYLDCQPQDILHYEKPGDVEPSPKE